MNQGANKVKVGENQQLANGSILRSNPMEPDDQFSRAKLQEKRRLQQAVVYGKTALRDFLKKQSYESLSDGRNPFEIAFADFLNAPSIDSIDLSEYSGRIGSRISITVIDDFAVSSVYIKIQNADGTIADEGFASPGLFSTEWVFTASQTNPDLTGDKITITATDLPGNDTLMERIL